MKLRFYLTQRVSFSEWLCLRFNVTQQITVGVHCISATLSARVWLMMATVRCPILLVATSHDAFSTARNKKKIHSDQKLMVESSLCYIDNLTSCMLFKHL